MTLQAANGNDAITQISIHEGELETIRKVVDRIDQVALKRMKEGFSERNFTIGVLNCLLITYVFGVYPQHFWVFFLVEGAFLIPTRLYYNSTAKPLNEVFYYMDYCWIMNLIGLFLLAIFVMHVTLDWSPSQEFRRQIYLTVFGVACGPLLGSTIILRFVAVVFHDIMIMTGVFIHILPPMLVYTFRWHADEIRDAWPSVFTLDYSQELLFFPEGSLFIVPGTGLGTIAGNTIALYLMWFILYVSWMILIGLDMPKKGRRGPDGAVIIPRYDTVFHATVRNGVCAAMGSTLWGRPRSVSKQQMENDDYELRDFLAYMALHAFLVYVSVYILAYPCFCSQYVHGVLLIFLIVICVRRGAERYTYYTTAMYGRAVRKDFAELLTEQTEDK